MITFPTWIVLMVLADLDEADGVNLVYPGHRLEEFSIWARFPQGMSRGLPLNAIFPGRAEVPGEVPGPSHP